MSFGVFGHCSLCGFIVIFVFVRAWSVSYTHLDVYKRQLIGLLHFLVGTVHGIRALDLVFQDLLCHSHRLEKAAVLILLDVYKRQDGGYLGRKNLHPLR